MTEQNEVNDPTWKAKDIGLGNSVVITLESPKAVTTGESKFGQWSLWTAQVENAKVQDKETKVMTAGYTGKAVFFPSKKMEEKLLALTNGTKEGVKVKITKLAKENSRGSPYTDYDVELVEGGKTPPSNILDSHFSFIKDFKNYISGGVINGTKQEFLEFGKSDTYKIDTTILEKLWIVFEEDSKK